MSAKIKKSAKGKRYTDAEKQAIIDFVSNHDAKKGRGGQAAACRKFKVSPATLTGWQTASAPAKTAKAAKSVKAVKTAKAAKPAKAVKVVTKVSRKKPKSPQGTRYTPEQKQTVLAYVAQVNAAKGRGGMSAAAKKFKVTPLTVATWINKFGAAKTKAPAAGPSQASLLAKLAKAEATIKRLQAKLAGK